MSPYPVPRDMWDKCLSGGDKLETNVKRNITYICFSIVIRNIKDLENPQKTNNLPLYMGDYEL